jgi:hypothetical protein
MPETGSCRWPGEVRRLKAAGKETLSIASAVRQSPAERPHSRAVRQELMDRASGVGPAQAKSAGNVAALRNDRFVDFLLTWQIRCLSKCKHRCEVPLPPPWGRPIER